jgi:hypothetical protein
MTEHKNTPNKTRQGVLSRMWTRSLGSPSQQQQPQAHGEDAREEHLARNDGENLNGASVKGKWHKVPNLILY